MSKQLDPLKITTPELHRFWFSVNTVDQWYAIMRECREWFGKNWQCQGKVRRKLDSRGFNRRAAHSIWFDIPDPKCATWISVKHSIRVASNAKHLSNK